jgi:hypothetical protein
MGEGFRPVLGFFNGIIGRNPVVCVQPCFDGGPISPTPQGFNLGETTQLGLTHGSAKAVPAHPGIDSAQ